MFSTAVAGIIIHMFTTGASEYVTLFWATMTGLIIFNCLNLRLSIKTYHSFIIKDTKIFLFLNIYAAISCLSFFFLQFIFDPSIVLLLGFSFLALIGAYKRLRGGKNRTYQLMIFLLIIFNMFLIYDYFDPYDSVLSLELFIGVFIYSLSTFLLANVASLASGCAGYSGKQILSVRFYIMAFFAIFLLLIHIKMEKVFDLESIFLGIMVGTLAYIFPVVFSQKAIEKIGSAKHSVFNWYDTINYMYYEIVV